MSMDKKEIHKKYQSVEEFMAQERQKHLCAWDAENILKSKNRIIGMEFPGIFSDMPPGCDRVRYHMTGPCITVSPILRKRVVSVLKPSASGIGKGRSNRR